MDINGHLRMLAENEKPAQDETLVDILEATQKQKEEMLVSPFDNRSPLGQIFTGNRAERRRQEKEARRSRRQHPTTASTGSGSNPTS